MRLTATHGNILQHAVTHCNALQRATLQHNATPCNTLQLPATPCNTLQHPATPCNTLQRPGEGALFLPSPCRLVWRILSTQQMHLCVCIPVCIRMSVLHSLVHPPPPPSFLPVQYCDTSIGYLFATHCNALLALQRTAMHCNSLQRAAIHCDTLRHTATHCNSLQHTATHCNTQVTASRQRAMSQYTATHCNALQLTATHLQHTCNTLQHTATHRLQCHVNGLSLYRQTTQAQAHLLQT